MQVRVAMAAGTPATPILPKTAVGAAKTAERRAQKTQLDETAYPFIFRGRPAATK